MAAAAAAAAVAHERRATLCGHSFQTVAQRSNIVRIFLSSTFLDFVHERNRLFNDAFPELEQWCQEKGVHFQVVDMRWGVRDRVAMDHGGPAVCLREVERCRQISIGPNFVAFIGDRYGRRPLPATIPSADFDSILMQIQDGDQRALLMASYRLDKNAIPPVYLIQSSIQTETSRTVEDSLRNILTTAAQRAVEKGAIRFAHPYTASITEQEVWNGILLSDDPEMHSLVFVRNFQHGANLQPKNRSVTNQFADFTENGDIDPVSEKMLYDLKNYILPSNLDDSNLFRYSIPFDEKYGVDPSLPSHAQYLKLVNETLLKNTKELIIEGLKKVPNTTTVGDDEVYAEVSSHATFAVAKAKLYCGKRKFLTRLYKKFMDSGNHQPYILYGDSGVGKTATIAKLILEAHKNIVSENSKSANIVYRFLGTTPDSSNLDRLLISLTKQICDIYGTVQEKEGDMVDFTNVTDMFYRALESASVASSRVSPLVIILDSLDQLSSNYGAHHMTWLRPTVPSHVSILLTTMPGAFGILERLQSRFAATTIELTESANEKASTVLMRLLKQEKRTITSSQAKTVAKVFEASQSPLLLHLTLIETRRWRSYTTTPSELRLGVTVTEAIDVLFDRMENVHGRLLVAHALGYLVASKNGLTAQEMEDVLSLDDQVLDDVYQYWAPPSNTEMRIPPLIWARLQEDMSDFIVFKQRDAATVMCMYHKQFTDAVRVRYLGDGATRKELHTKLAEYFDGPWATRAKAISLKILNNEHREFNRKVRAQPLVFAKDRYNLRKMNELPHHLIAANNSSKFTNDLLTNIDWLEAKFQACGTDAIIADIDEYLMQENANKKSSPEIASILTIRQALRLAKPTIDFAKETTREGESSAARKRETRLATELLGRLYDHAANSEIIGRLLLGAKQWCESGVAEQLLLVPENQCFSSPSGPLETTLVVPGAQCVAAVVHSVEFGATVTVDAASTLRLWNLSADSVVHTAKIGERYSYRGGYTLQDAIVISNDHKYVYSWNSDYGLLCFGLIAAAQLYQRSPEQLISNAEAVDIDVPLKTTTIAMKRPKSATQLCRTLNNHRLALGSSNSHEVLIVNSLDGTLLKRFRLTAPSTFLSFDGDSIVFVGCNESLMAVSLTDWQVGVESVGMSVFSADCISVAKKRHLALIGFNEMKTVLLIRRLKKTESNGKLKAQQISLHRSQRALFSQAHDACICVGFKHDVVVVITAGWSKRRLKQKRAVCSMKVADHPRNNKSALMFIGNADGVSVYDCCGSIPVVQEVSGTWGQPNLLHVGGPFLFVASTQSAFVKVWNIGRLVDSDKNNNSNHELAKSSESTYWLNERSTISCHLSESRRTAILDDGLEKSEVTLTGDVTSVFCLVTENNLVYVTDHLVLCRMMLKEKKCATLCQLSSPVVSFSQSKEHAVLVVLVENGSTVQVNVNDWTVKNCAKANVEARICDVSIFGSYQLLLCEKNAILTSFNERQDKLMTFDWPHHAVVAYAGCRNILAVCLQLSPETDKKVELRNMNTMTQCCSVDLNDMTSISCLCLSVDAKYLLVAGDDRFIRIIDTQSGTVLRKNVYVYSPIRSMIAFNGQVVGVLLSDRRLCRLKIVFPSAPEQTTITNARQNRSSTCTVL